MSSAWSDYLSRLLQATNKVEKAAVFNNQGQPLAVSDNLQVNEADGRALIMCLKDPARSLTRINIDDTDYRCFQGNDNALVGKAVGHKDRILVAKHTDEVLILVMGNSSGHGSFLFEVKKSLQERQQRMRESRQIASNGTGTAAAGGGGAASQQQVQQGGGQLKLAPPPGSGQVSQEQVLVQLHD